MNRVTDEERMCTDCERSLSLSFLLLLATMSIDFRFLVLKLHTRCDHNRDKQFGFLKNCFGYSSFFFFLF